MRTSLLLLLLTLGLGAGCDGRLLAPEPPATPVAVFDELWGEVDRYYAHFGLKEVDWHALRDTLRPTLSDATDEAALFAVLCAMLVRLEDGHVNLYAPPPLGTCSYSDWYTRYPHNFNPDLLWRSYFAQRLRVTGDGRIGYGRLSDTVGYVYVASFSGHGWIDAVDDALQALRPFEALVLDVRDNGGGSSDNGDALAGRFADARRLFSYVRYRNGPAHDDLTAPQARYVEPTGRERFTGPVAVLTNRRCFSACEGFVLAMDVLPHVTLVGDTTGGGLGNPLFRELQNGWSFRVPVWLQTTPQDAAIEDIGIAPDLPVHLTPEDEARDRDTILEAALQHLAGR